MGKQSSALARTWAPLMVLVLLGFLTRVLAVGYPNSVVFDEAYFGEFSSAYSCSGERIFDVHPPHAKLLIAATAKLTGYRCDLSFRQIGDSYGTRSALPLRLAPALAGAFLPAIVFVLLKLLRVTTTAALVGAVLILIENSLIVQSRMIGLDSIMLSAMFAGLVCYLAARRATTLLGDLGFCAAAGALLGLAAGSKLIGLAALGLVLISIGVDFVRTLPVASARKLIMRVMMIGVCAAAVYLVGWKLHFALLTQPGSGDEWIVPGGEFFSDLIRYEHTMFAGHQSSTDAHPYQSRWWQWPFMRRPILYWQPDPEHQIVFIGNPLIWLGSAVLICIVITYQALMAITTRCQKYANARRSANDSDTSRAADDWIPLAGFALCYLPMIPIERTMFMYHYLATLIFAIVAAVVWLDRIGWIRPLALHRQHVSVKLTLACCVLGSLLVSPLSYGLSAPEFVRNFW